jgi:hypothetical protein
MGAMSPAKLKALSGKGGSPFKKFNDGGVTKTRKDGDKFTEYAEGGKVGLYANIHAKRARGEKMRKPGDPGAPTAEAFKQSAKTARK